MRSEEQLRGEALTFGVMAPQTGEGTTLEMDGDPYSRSVVKGVPLNVEDDARFLFHAESPFFGHYESFRLF